MPSLNIGCGPLRIDGEVGVDFYPTEACDVRGDVLHLPFRSQSVDFVRLDHVLEHLPQRYAVVALMEAYRVLKPSGQVRVGVPDIEATCRTYAESSSIQDKALLLRWLYGSQAHGGEYHKSGWDAQTLEDVLDFVGFERIAVHPDPARTEGICIAATAVRP